MADSNKIIQNYIIYLKKLIEIFFMYIDVKIKTQHKGAIKLHI